MNKEIINKKYKILRIFFAISITMRAINLVINILWKILIYCNIITPVSQVLDWVIGMALLKFTMTCCLYKRKPKAEGDIPDTLNNITKDVFILTVMIIFISILLIIGAITSNPLIPFILGYTSLGSISFIAGYITLLMLKSDFKYVQKVNEYGSEEAYNEAMIKEINERKKEEERKQQLQEERKKELRLQKEHDTTLRLLDETGRNFFIKYYEKLQSWSIPDIVDEIEEAYSEDSKLERIEKAKKLFALNLNVTALEIIANDSNLVNNETHDKAITLLQQKSTDD